MEDLPVGVRGVAKGVIASRGNTFTREILFLFAFALIRLHLKFSYSGIFWEMRFSPFTEDFVCVCVFTKTSISRGDNFPLQNSLCNFWFSTNTVYRNTMYVK